MKLIEKFRYRLPWSMTTLAVSPNDFQMATMAFGRPMFRGDLLSGSLSPWLRLDPMGSQDLRFSPDGHYLVAASAKAIRLIDWQSGAVLKEISNPPGCPFASTRAVEFSTDGASLWARCGDGTNPKQSVVLKAVKLSVPGLEIIDQLSLPQFDGEWYLSTSALGAGTAGPYLILHHRTTEQLDEFTPDVGKWRHRLSCKLLESSEQCPLSIEREPGVRLTSAEQVWLTRQLDRVALVASWQTSPGQFTQQLMILETRTGRRLFDKTLASIGAFGALNAASFADNDSVFLAGLLDRLLMVDIQSSATHLLPMRDDDDKSSIYVVQYLPQKKLVVAATMLTLRGFELAQSK